MIIGSDLSARINIRFITYAITIAKTHNVTHAPGLVLYTYYLNILKLGIS